MNLNSKPDEFVKNVLTRNEFIKKNPKECMKYGIDSQLVPNLLSTSITFHVNRNAVSVP